MATRVVGPLEAAVGGQRHQPVSPLLVLVCAVSLNFGEVFAVIKNMLVEPETSFFGEAWF